MNIKTYIEHKAPRAVDQATYVHEGLCELPDHALLVILDRVDNDDIVSYGVIGSLVVHAIRRAYSEKAAEYAREQAEINRRGVMREVQENTNPVGESA